MRLPIQFILASLMIAELSNSNALSLNTDGAVEIKEASINCMQQDGREYMMILEDKTAIYVDRSENKTMTGTFWLSGDTLSVDFAGTNYPYYFNDAMSLYGGVYQSPTMGHTCRGETLNGKSISHKIIDACRAAIESVANVHEVSLGGVINFESAHSCAALIGFSDAASMLNFVDERMAADQSPVTAIVSVGNIEYEIPLSLQVTGSVIFIPPGSQEIPQIPRSVHARTEAEISLLESLVKVSATEARIGRMAAGDFLLKGGQALTLTFKSAHDLRAYVARSIASQVNPSPIAWRPNHLSDVLAIPAIMLIDQGGF